MKVGLRFALMATVWAVLACGSAFAFTSGSTGVDGAFAPSANTEVALPPDGVLNYTTVNIPTGVVVTFKPNATNTAVYMLATGDVTVAGTISVNGLNGNALAPGRGGPAGFDGGVGGTANACGGPGVGPGGGKAAVRTATPMTSGAGGGGGGYGAAGSKGAQPSGGTATGGDGGATYGNSSIVPSVGGSGGGGGCAADGSYLAGGGGGGGGAIVIASSGIINVTGSITAGGGIGAAQVGGGATGGGGGGSGGAIRLVANTIKGEGIISANVGAGGAGINGNYNGGAGGVGRIRLEADPGNLLRTTNTTPPYTIGSPTAVFPVTSPSLKIARIGGIAVPAAAAGEYGSPDIVLPTTITNPITIDVEATNIPPGTAVTVLAMPELGSTSSATGTLSGTDSLTTASAQVTLSGKTVSIIIASATFTLAANSSPIYADGEKVAKVKVDSVMGRGSKVIYITESGREVRAAM